MSSAQDLILAKEMLAEGFYVRIVSLETKLSKKLIRKLFGRVQSSESMPTYHTRSGSEPTGMKLIKNTVSKLHASLIMGLYESLGGKAVFGACNLKALATAFKLYQAEIAKIDKPPLFDINNAWYLARELRERTASMDQCPICKYRYFHSINQRTDLDCPFCFRASGGSDA